MIRKGYISDLNDSSARVTFPDLNNAVSGWLAINKFKVKCSGECKCTNCIATLDLEIGVMVIVCLYDSLNSGIIIAKGSDY
ncbi:hypothetical protein DVV81_08170 [Clostridium botulinum]|uniref:hypothetical protein n=1 Tax=Clostridium botulinum TaxID=1491 RepID=UPI001967E6AC|nr:hypothetical protein [Clostridium botulinum]MBN1071144.1 hypothetical protein [Clostridium botulinum]